VRGQAGCCGTGRGTQAALGQLLNPLPAAGQPAAFPAELSLAAQGEHDRKIVPQLIVKVFTLCNKQTQHLSRKIKCHLVLFQHLFCFLCLL